MHGSHFTKRLYICMVDKAGESLHTHISIYIYIYKCTFLGYSVIIITVRRQYREICVRVSCITFSFFPSKFQKENEYFEVTDAGRYK